MLYEVITRLPILVNNEGSLSFTKQISQFLEFFKLVIIVPLIDFGPIESIKCSSASTSIPVPKALNILFSKLCDLVDRITSYNVCYTKLLRSPIFSASCGESC